MCFFLAFIASLSVFFPFLYACKGEGQKQIMLLGSPVSYYVTDYGYTENSIKDRKISQSLYELCERLNKTFSTEEDSQISAYNTVIGQKSIKIDEDFYYLTTIFKELYSKTDGAVNPQVKLSVDLWGFSKRYKEPNYLPEKIFDRKRNEDGSFPLPEKEYIEGFKKLADFSKTVPEKKTVQGDIQKTELYIHKSDLSVTIDNQTYYSALDYSSAVKGYFCDEAKKIFARFGVKNYYISAGGSSMYLSENNAAEWNLKIINPFSASRDALISLPVSDKFVSTSGTYENYYELGGVRYSHIIDPKTGCPAQSKIVSATVIGENGAYTDALSTALINLDDKAADFMSGMPYDYVLITEDGKVLSNVYDRLTFL